MVAISMYLFHIWLVLYIMNYVAADTLNVYSMDTTISNISCDNSTTINISKTSVIDEDDLNFCKNKKCQLNKEDASILEKCNGRQSCSIFTNFSSKCLYRREYINISYTCKAPTNLKCNFEYSDICNWKLNVADPVDIIDWMKKTAKDVGELSHDHTTGKGYGHYAIMYKADDTIKTANIVSAPIVSFKILCLTFWYVAKEDDFISVILKYNKTYLSQQIYTINSPNTGYWTKVSLDIDIKGSYSIVIQGTLNSGKYIAIDDIDVLNGSCNDTFKTIDTFEYDDFGDWSQQMSPNITVSTICGLDHTTDTDDGRCAVITVKENSRGSYRLVRKLNSTTIERMCLQLWYNAAIIGTNEVKININLEESNKLKHRLMNGLVLSPGVSNDENNWKEILLNFNISGFISLVIEVQFNHSNEQRLVGIDDITLQNCDCPGTKVFTDQCVNVDHSITLEKCPSRYISDISFKYGQTNNANTSCPGEAVKNKISKICEDSNTIYCTFSFPLNETSCLDVRRNLTIAYECTNDEQLDETKPSTTVIDVQLNEKESNITVIAAVVGVIGGLILILLIAVVVFAIRRNRNNAGDKMKESGELIGTGHDQSELNGGRDKVTHYNTVYDDREPSRIKKGNKDDGYDTANNVSAKNDDINEHVYDRNTDGVYDTSTHKKQNDYDTGIYGRTTNDVYDTSNDTRRRQDDDVNIYDTNTNGDDVYDTSSNSRRTDNDLNIYGRSVDSVYDVSDNCKRDNVPDQTYDHLPQ